MRDEVSGEYSGFLGKDIYIIYKRLKAVRISSRKGGRADAADDTKFGTDLEAHAAVYYATRVTVHDRDCVAYYVHGSVISPTLLISPTILILLILCGSTRGRTPAIYSRSNGTSQAPYSN